jgi:hypothetical protein
MRTRCPYKYNVAGILIALRRHRVSVPVVQHGCGGTHIDGNAKPRSSGCTFKGRSRGFSSAQRTAGITPVARHGRCSFTSPVSGETFHIYDKNSSKLHKPRGWLSLKTTEDEINHILSRVESKFCTPNGGTCTSKTTGLLVRRHIVAGEFHYIGKEASTRWAGGVDLSMMSEAGDLDPADETFREYERVVDPNYLERIWTEAKQFSTKLLSRQSRVAECAIRHFKNGRNTIKPRTLRKLTRAIHDLQNKKPEKL